MNRSQHKTRSPHFDCCNPLWFNACLTCSGFSIVRCLRPGFSLSSGFFRAKKRILRRKDNNEPRTTTFKPQAPGLKSQAPGLHRTLFNIIQETSRLLLFLKGFRERRASENGQTSISAARLALAHLPREEHVGRIIDPPAF